jgi:hypothetical protein
MITFDKTVPNMRDLAGMYSAGYSLQLHSTRPRKCDYQLKYKL